MATDATGSVTTPDSLPTYLTAVDAPSGKGLNAIVAAIQTALTNRERKATFNVKDPTYGAVGDGVANDTTAIQAAITAAAAVHGTVFLPTGVYKITSALTLPSGAGSFDTGAITIQGSNRNGSRISQATANTPIFTTGTSGAFVQSIAIRDLTMEYAAQAAVTDTQSFAIAFAATSPLATSFSIERCWINRSYVGIGVSGSSGVISPWNIRVVDTWITSTKRSAIKLVSPTPAGMPSNHFEHLYIANTGVGGIGGAPIASTGPCFELAAASATLNDIDIEGWYNNLITYNGNPHALVSQGLYVEHHVFDNTSVYGATPFMFDLASDSVFDGTNLSVGNVNNVTAYLFAVTSASLHLRGISTSLVFTGTGNAVGFTASGTTKLFYRGDWRKNLGAINVDDASNPSNDYIVGGARTLAYSASIATDASTSVLFRIVGTNGTAFTISDPTLGTTGKQITYDIKNSSGGALGVITWGASFLLAGAFTNPANTKRRTISFYFDGANWVETNRASADI